MGTFLTNPKMGPALRARVERSVSGARGPQRRSRRPGAVATLRVALIAVAIGAVFLVVSTRRRALLEIESARAETREQVLKSRDRLTDRGRRFVPAVEALLIREAGTYAGDVHAEKLAGPEALDRLLARPSVYLRAQLAAAKALESLRQTAADSGKETFLHCLVDPPPSREERALVSRVDGVYQGQASAREKTAHIHRLDDAFVAARFLEPAWLERLERTVSMKELSASRSSLRRADLAEKQKALEVDTVIYVLDEEQEAGTVSEFDGESRHMVRIGIVEIASGRVLLRLRRQSDPAWISERRRVAFARGFEGCRMAFDLHRELAAPMVAR